MPVPLITKQMHEFLEAKSFIYVGTCDFENRPNVAPKFVVKIEEDIIYLADYVIGRTFANIKISNKVSISSFNIDILVGYQLNGHAQILENGDEYNKITEDMRKRQVDLSVKRFFEGLQGLKKHKHFEIAFPDRVVIFKVKVDEVVEIGSSGKLERKTRPG